ncbi:ComF family protein [Rhizobium sp. KVB221]|uniref:ComF family protein n=1 Tax=Rhizobium setariae TaxID=2801340 RepID=A0A936YS28_9HYPH|nr:ComF family protein [Rhizobium setariae]MBL0374688.1 ComF family protein [Rhizobium setariae]
MFAVDHLAAMLRRAGDFLFPPACAGCGRMLASHGAVCQRCWQSIAFIERPYCQVLGIPFSHDLGEGFLSAEAIANPPEFDRLRSVCAFDAAARSLVHALKYRDRTELAPMMAGWMARAGKELLADCDVLIPVPLHTRRLLSRRFNQAAELAFAVSRQTGKPMLATAVRRTRNTAHQVGLGRAGREDNVRGAFTVTVNGKQEVMGKRIVLIDDVYTTGATVSAIARALRRAGAADIAVLTFARALPDTI